MRASVALALLSVALVSPVLHAQEVGDTYTGAPAPASADEPAPAAAAPAPAAAAPAPAPVVSDSAPAKPAPMNLVSTAPPKKKKKAKLAWSGRIFVGDTLSRTEIGGQKFWRNQQGVNSARVGLKYEHPDGLTTVVKLEVGDGKADLKDGYIRLKSETGSYLQAGRFKKPISSVALASKWDLPSIERGILDSISVEEQALPFTGGRADGVLLQYRAASAGKPGLSVSLFQNDLGTGLVSLDAKDNFTQDFYLRASVEPSKGLVLASSAALIGYLSMTGDSGSFKHAKVGSVEVTYQGRWLLGWLEGFVGQSPFAKVNGSTSGHFVAGRALVAPRLRPGVPRRLFPFVGASYFDPRTKEKNNANSEVQLGANLEFSKVWRLQLEAGRVFAEGGFSSAIESTVFRIQLGARFKE